MGPRHFRRLRAACWRRGLARVDIAMIDAGDPLRDALHAAASDAGRAAIDRQVAIQPYVTLKDDSEAYTAGLPRKQRKEIGRRRRLEAEGELTVHFEDGSERLDELLREGFAIEGSGWKAERGSAIASQPETHAFYTDVARWAAARGWLRLAFLRLDGRALAFDLCIEFGRVRVRPEGRLRSRVPPLRPRGRAHLRVALSRVRREALDLRVPRRRRQLQARLDRHHPGTAPFAGLFQLTPRPGATRGMALRAPAREARRRPAGARMTPVSSEARMIARLTDVSGVAGNRGRTVGSWIDLARSVGFARSLRRARNGGQGVLPAEVRNAVYEAIWREAADEQGAELTRAAPASSRSRATAARASCSSSSRSSTTPSRSGSRSTSRPSTNCCGPPASHARARRVRVLGPRAGSAIHGRDRRPVRGEGRQRHGRGEGTTAGVDTPARLMRARLRSGRFGSRLLIERQVPGAVYRLPLSRRRADRRAPPRPPGLTGDGRSTIEELIDAENARRLAGNGAAGLSLLDVGLDTVFTLERAGLGLDSVPRAGETISVQTVTNDNGIEDTETFKEPLAPELVDAAKRAAAAVGLRLAGVDVITPDPSRPLEGAGGVVAEVDEHPGIHHHYHVADPADATRVAIPILGKVLA